MFSFFNKIEFWIGLFFVIRLWGITDPPLEMGHHWRQVTGLMVARNFLEVDANIFFPRVDESNGGTGIIGMEFPLLNYLHFLISLLFGYQHWYGRAINLIISSIGILYFYKIIKKVLEEEIAFYATLALLGSTWFVFSRKMMPDTFCMALMFVGLYFGCQYIIYPKTKDLLLFFSFTTLGALSKIPALMGFTFIIWFWWKYKPSKKIMLLQAVFIFFSILMVYYWYFVWNLYLSEIYGNWYNIGKSFAKGSEELSENLLKIAENFYFHSFNSFILLGISIGGILHALYRKEKSIIIITALFLSIFIIYAIKSGYFFYHHNYYMIPFIPIMAIWVGYGLNSISSSYLKTLILFAGIIESIANQQHDFIIKPQEYQKMELEAILDSFMSRNDLIAVNGNGNPQLIYLSHRKGWIANDEDFKDPNFINSIKNKGCKWILIEKNDKIQNVKNLEKKFENQRFIIYKIIK